jgi:AraC-like DNA-binding protein
VTAFSPQFVRKMIAVYDGPEDHDTLLRSVGLPPGREADVGSEALQRTVSADATYELFERLMVGDDGTLPLRYARSLEPDDFGALGLAIKTAATLRGALQRIARYMLLLTDTLTYALQERPGGAAFVLRGRRAHRPAIRVANEGALAGVLSIVRQITAVPVSPASVSFRHARPDSVEGHRRYFGCPVRFGAESDALDFDERTLAADTRLGDEGLSRYLLGHLDDLRASAQDRSLEARIRDVVTGALSNGVPPMAAVARRLGMSERTLHRRLAEDGGAYRELVERTRRDLAESLLERHDYPLAEIAFLTGFSEQSAFHRAFKRWTGRTPAAFRHAVRGGPPERRA